MWIRIMDKYQFNNIYWWKYLESSFWTSQKPSLESGNCMNFLEMSFDLRETFSVVGHFFFDSGHVLGKDQISESQVVAGQETCTLPLNFHYNFRRTRRTPLEVGRQESKILVSSGKKNIFFQLFKFLSSLGENSNHGIIVWLYLGIKILKIPFKAKQL